MGTNTIFITGTSTGIGRSAAKLFSEKGWNVIATQRQPDKEKKLTKLPGIVLLKLDVTSQQSIDQCVREAYSRFPRIDVLVNNAGYGSLGAFEAATDEQIKQQFDTNVFGMMAVTKAFLPHFRTQKSGTIINISSIAGRIGFPLFSIYNSSKFAVEGFSEGLMYELRQFGIKVRIVEPGPIDTDFYSRSMNFISDEALLDYSAFSKKVTKFTVDSGTKAQGPKIVARTIFEAATSRCNKLRYPVGGGAPSMLFFSKLLPGCIMRFVVRKVFFI